MTSGSVARRRQQKATQVRRGLTDFLKMAVVVLILTLAVIFVIRMVNGRTPPVDRFCEGVYVNGVSLGGMTRAEGEQLVLGQVDKRLNQDSFLLTYGDKQWTFTPSEFDAHLDLTQELEWAWNFGHTGTDSEKREQAEYVKNNPQYYNKEIAYDQVRFEDFLAAVKAEIDIPAVDATVIAGEDEILTFTDSQVGQSLSIDSIRKTLEAAIMNGTTATIDLSQNVVVKEPAVSTDALKYNSQLIATHKTPTNESSTNRTKNIARALKSFDGFIVLPGQTVSFNEVVGKRTKANGFFKSPEYDGTEIIDGIGGGTCQASTTLYCALLKADMVVGVRYAHTMRVGYCLPSLDAAVSDKKDLVFTNFKDYPIYIYTTVDNTRAEVRIYGPPPEYDIKLEYKIISEFEAPKSKYVKDTTGKRVYFKTDPPLLKEEGKAGMKSQGYRVYYEKGTNNVVLSEDFAIDTYRARQATYWIGVHE